MKFIDETALISKIDKISDGYIKNLEFNVRLHQKTIN